MVRPADDRQAETAWDDESQLRACVPRRRTRFVMNNGASCC